jgi:hypothetical protein
MTCCDLLCDLAGCWLIVKVIIFALWWVETDREMR